MLGEQREKRTSVILTLVFIVSLSGRYKDTDPRFHIQNERSNKANVQIQTSGGNTININEVQPGQITGYQSVSEGKIDVTAVVQNESVSPKATFNAGKNNRCTIAIQINNPPSIRVDQE